MQDTLLPKSTGLLPRKRWLRPDMTEKLLTGTLSLNTNKQNIECYFCSWVLKIGRTISFYYGSWTGFRFDKDKQICPNFLSVQSFELDLDLCQLDHDLHVFQDLKDLETAMCDY